MNKKLYILLSVLVVFGLLLTGCEKKLSTAAPVDGKAFPTPLPVNLTEVVLATQMAVNAMATIEPRAVTATPAVMVATIVEMSVPATPVPTAYTIPTLARPTTYTLQKGEFPYCIARRYDIDPGSLLAANGLSTTSKPAVGYTLKIPATGNWTVSDRALKAHPATYSVQSGDSLNSIACLYGDVSPEGIIAANGLVSPYTITTGQVLQIP